MNSNTLDIVTRRDGDTVLRREIRTTPTQAIPVHDTSSPKHTKPVLFVADADPVLRRELTAALKRRFGSRLSRPLCGDARSCPEHTPSPS